MTTQHNLDSAAANRPPHETRPASLVRRVPVWAFLAVGGAILVILTVAALALGGTTSDAQDGEAAANVKATAVQNQAAPLAGQVHTLCQAGGQAATQLDRAGACTQAQRVISAVQVPVPGPTGKQGPGPSDAQVQAFVDQYFAIHPLPPGQLPSVSEVAGLVASYLQQHPPANGQDASPAMVAGQVNDYCAQHNGCGAGSDQIAAQVAAYCAQASNPCQGPKGDTGDTGAKGDTGDTGAAGKDGASGAQGPPVAGWTYQDALGATHTCTMAPPPDGQTAPWYACT